MAVNAHEIALLVSGREDEKLEALRNLHRHQDSPAFAPLERLVLDLAVATARASADVPAEITAELEEALRGSSSWRR